MIEMLEESSKADLLYQKPGPSHVRLETSNLVALEEPCEVLGSGMEVTQNLRDGKRGILSSASKVSSKRNFGTKNLKSLKRQHSATKWEKSKTQHFSSR